jgi:4-nitrophenyl phosphatase
VLDLDGVIWLAGEPIPGSGEAVRHLHEAGAKVLFASNNSNPTVAELQARMDRAGIEVAPEEIVTSAQAAVSLVDPGAKVLVVGGGGLREALEHAQLAIVDTPEEADTVIVGWTREFSFERLTRAARAVWAGARLIGTNDDPSHPTPDGLLPGTGAIVAAVATASSTTPTIAGKPYRPLSDLVARRAPDTAVVVGDRAETDGQLAQHLGVPFALVLSGVTKPGDDYGQPAPTVVADDLLGVVTGALR